MKMFLTGLMLLAVSGCRGDETVAGYGAADRVWLLQQIDDQPFRARATLTFPETGRIAGRAPCNSYSAGMDVPYPWFETGAILSTKRACPDLDQEGRFFSALAAMTLSEVAGDTLLLSNASGATMLFTATAPDDQ